MTQGEEPAPYEIAVLYEDDAHQTLPTSFSVSVNLPLHVQSISELDLEVVNNSALTICGCYNLKVQLPLRVDEDSVRAKYKKKKNLLVVKARILTLEEGQPKALVDNVEKARRELLSVDSFRPNSDKQPSDEVKPSLRDKPLQNNNKENKAKGSLTAFSRVTAQFGELPEPPQKCQSSPPPSSSSLLGSSTPSSSVPSATALYEKYKKVKANASESAVKKQPVQASEHSGRSQPARAPPSSASVSSRDDGRSGSAARYNNTEVTVLNHPTDRMQLISPSALIEVVTTCLKIADGRMNNYNSKSSKLQGTTTLKEVMESFPSKSQSELCRQLLQEAAKYAVRSDNHSPSLPPDVKARFVKLAEFQMKKIEEILSKNEEKHKSLVRQGQLHEARQNDPSNPSRQPQPHQLHAPVFDKDALPGDAKDLEAVSLADMEQQMQVNGKVSSGSLSALLLKSVKGSEKRKVKQTLASKANKLARKLQENGFAVLDSFVAPGKVKELRKELDNLNAHYTPSEIWVGKGAGLGAQIKVPDVRGDKVLWMCGGHTKVRKKTPSSWRCAPVSIFFY